MKKIKNWVYFFVTLTFYVGIGVYVSNASDFSQEKTNYVFIIDVSGSMEGKGDGNPAVIFPDVKKFLNNYTDQIEMGSSIYFFPFDTSIHDEKSWHSVGANRSAIHDYVNNLKAEGVSTYIYQSLKDVFLRLRENILKDNPQKVHTTNIVYLFTDGLDTSPSKISLQDAIDYFKLTLVDTNWERKNDWFYYITLNSSLPENDQEVISKTEGAEIYNNPRDEVKAPVIIKPKLKHLVFSNLQGSENPRAIEGFTLRGTTIETPSLVAEVNFDNIGSYYTFELTPDSFIADSKIEFTFEPFSSGPAIQIDHPLTGSIFFRSLGNLPVTIIPDSATFVITNCPSNLYFEFQQKKNDSGYYQIPTIDLNYTDADSILIPINLYMDSGHCEVGEDLLLTAELIFEEKNAQPVDISFHTTNNNFLQIPISEFSMNDSVTKNIKIDWKDNEELGPFSVVLTLKSQDFAQRTTSLVIKGETIKSWPWWFSVIIILGTLIILLLIILIVASLLTGISVGGLILTTLAQFGIKKAALKGTLIWITPEKQDRVQLEGQSKIIVGQGGLLFQNLPYTLELEAKYYRGKPVNVVKTYSSNIIKKEISGKQIQMLSGKSYHFVLDNTIVFDDNNKLTLKN